MARQPAQRGQVLVLFAGGLATLLVVAALAFDVGMMLLERRDQQNAADAAALAGARYILTSESDARTAAARIAQLNGFDDAAADEAVTIHIPAVHGRYAGMPGFIEVQIEATRPSIFGGIIGRAVWPVGAFAVATNRQDLTFPFGMLALDPTACKAIQVSGGGYVEAYSSIQANSNGADCDGDPISFSRTGGSTIKVGTDVFCRAVGDIQDQGSGTMGACIQAPNSFALPDPLRNLAAPARPPVAPGLVYVGSTSPAPNIPKNCPGGSQPPTELAPRTCKLAPTGSYAGTSWILYPGLYPGGIEVTANTTAYLMPGIYWLGGGGLRVATGGSIVTVGTESDATPLVADATWGGGALIYNSQLPAAPGGPIVLDGSAATMLLKPAAFGTTDPRAIYNDIVIFQDRTLTTAVTLNGSASTTEVEGIIYVPGGEVKLNGNGGTLVVDQVIANTYLIDGNGGTIKVMRDKGVDAIIVAAGLVE